MPSPFFFIFCLFVVEMSGAKPLPSLFGRDVPSHSEPLEDTHYLSFLDVPSSIPPPMTSSQRQKHLDAFKEQDRRLTALRKKAKVLSRADAHLLQSPRPPSPDRPWETPPSTKQSAVSPAQKTSPPKAPTSHKETPPVEKAPHPQTSPAQKTSPPKVPASHEKTPPAQKKPHQDTWRLAVLYFDPKSAHLTVQALSVLKRVVSFARTHQETALKLLGYGGPADGLRIEALYAVAQKRVHTVESFLGAHLPHTPLISLVKGRIIMQDQRREHRIDVKVFFRTHSTH